MALEQWYDTVQSGDVVSRTVLLDEIKANLIAVLNDYLGKGDDVAETAMIAKAEKLFNGTIVPIRDDWDVLVESFRLLSIVKERGVMYEAFLADVSDSLGVSDLQRIKAFLDDIQRIPPEAGLLSIALDKPDLYWVTPPKATILNSGEQLALTWTLDTSALGQAAAVFSLTESASEDIASYQIAMTAGSFSRTDVLTGLHPNPTPILLDWNNWFTGAELKDVWFSATLSTIDKRGNVALTSPIQEKYPSGTFVPQGIRTYEMEYSINGGSYAPLIKQTGTSYTWTTPKLTGTYQFRVRAIDLNGQTYGGFDGQTQSDWATSTPLYLSFIPEKPDKPNPSATTTWNTATITWPAVARAEWYEVWNANYEQAKAGENDSAGINYWQRIDATAERRVVLSGLLPDCYHEITVRAGNAGGTNDGHVRPRTLPRVLKSAYYTNNYYNVFETDYNRYWQNWSFNYVPSHWVPHNYNPYIYQGEWRDDYWGTTSWNWYRGGGTYAAHAGQLWGNHASFFFFDLATIRSQMANKSIQKVTFDLKRASGTTGLNAHGFSSAKPLYLYNHRRYSWTDTQYADQFEMYFSNGVKATRWSQSPFANVQFDRGETEWISNENSKRMFQNMVDGTMEGIGIVKYYGDSLYDSPTYSDEAYMILAPHIGIQVHYYDN